MSYITTSIFKTLLITTGSDFVGYESIIKDEPVAHYKYESSVTHQVDVYSEIRHELLSYSSLTTNWDGYEAVKPPEENIQNVKLFLSLLTFLDMDIVVPNIMLSGAGDISLYWELDEKYMELNFTLI